MEVKDFGRIVRILKIHSEVQQIYLAGNIQMYYIRF